MGPEMMKSESGIDYSDVELDMEETSELDPREWLFTSFDGIWRAGAFKTLLNFDIFTEKALSAYTSDVLKDINGFIAPLEECVESNEEMKWYFYFFLTPY